MSRTPQLFNSRAVDSRSDNCSCFKSARRAEQEEKDVPEVLAPPANDDAPILIDLVSPTLGWCLPLEARARGITSPARSSAAYVCSFGSSDFCSADGDTTSLISRPNADSIRPRVSLAFKHDIPRDARRTWSRLSVRVIEFSKPA